MVISELPDRPHLERVKKMAKSLHRATVAGDPEALGRIHAVAETPSLSAAQTTLAHEHGFANWIAFRAEIERRSGGSA